MAYNAKQMRIGVTGHVWVAPVGTTAPVDTATSMSTVSASWLELGYTSEKGVELNFAPGFTDYGVWQALSPVRSVYSKLEFTCVTELEQINSSTLPFWFGGGATVTNPSEAGGNLYHVSNNPTVDERSLVIEFSDGSSVAYRIYFPRGIAADRGKTTVGRTGELMLPVTYKALAVDTNTDLATLILKDVNFS